MEPQNCWDFWDCPKEVRDECPAYKTNSGRECFFVAENFCPRLRKKEGRKLSIAGNVHGIRK